MYLRQQIKSTQLSNIVSEIQVCEQALSDNEADYWQVRGSKLGRFYLLPKIHKGLSDVVGRLLRYY